MWGILVSVGVNLLAAGVNYLLRDDDPEIDAQAQAQRGMESRPVASGDSIPVVYGSVGVSAKVIWAAPATSGNGDDVRAWQVGRTLSQTGGVWDPATDAFRRDDKTGHVQAQQFHAVLCQSPIDSISRVALSWEGDSERLHIITDSSAEDYHKPWEFEFSGSNISTDHAIYLPARMATRLDYPTRYEELNRYGSGEHFSTGVPGQGSYDEMVRAMAFRSLYIDLYPDGLSNIGGNINWPQYMDKDALEDTDLVSGQVLYKGVVSIMGTVTGRESYRSSDDGNIDTSTPRDIRCMVTRQRTWDRWEPSLAAIGQDMNPVHVMYDLMTNPQYGANIPPSEIHTQSFEDAAQYAYDTSLGVSFQASPKAISSHISELLGVMDASVYLDPETGKVALSVAKKSGAPLVTLSDDNCTAEWVKETPKLSPTGLSISYRRRDPTDDLTRDDEKKLHYEYTPLWESEQSILEKSYPMIREDKSALMRATKDFLYAQRHYTSVALSIPWVNYPAGLRIGSAIEWGSGLHGVPMTIYRVTNIDLGDDEAAEVRIEARANWVDVDEPLWDDPPSQDREPPKEYEDPPVRALVLPVHLAKDLRPELSQFGWASSDEAENTYAVAVLAAPEQPVSYLKLWRQVPADSNTDPANNYELVSSGQPTARRSLASSLAPTASQVNLDIPLPFETYRPGDELLILIGDEIIAAEVHQDAQDTLTVVDRGLYDTVRPPSSHPTGRTLWVLSSGGERMWLPPRFLVPKKDDYIYRAQPVAPDGSTTPVGMLTTMTTPDQNDPIPRTFQPLPPSRLEAVVSLGDLKVMWRYRRRDESTHRPGWSSPFAGTPDPDTRMVLEILGRSGTTIDKIYEWETGDPQVKSRDVPVSSLEASWASRGNPGTPEEYIVRAWTYYDLPKYNDRESRSLYTYEARVSV